MKTLKGLFMQKEQYFKSILQTPFSGQYINYMVRMCQERGTFFFLVPCTYLNMVRYRGLNKRALFDQDWIQVQLC